MDKVLKAHLALFSANILYGINYIIAKGVMPFYVNPFALTLTRIVGALILFWGVSAFSAGQKIEKRDWPRLIGASLFGIALNQSLFLNGLNLTSPIDASIIMTSNPVLVMFMAAILLKEPVTSKKIFGIISGATGAVLLILFSGNVSFGSDNFLGNIMIFCNAFSYAVYLVIVKPLMSKYNPVTVMRWIFLFGFCFVSPFAMDDFISTGWASMPSVIVTGVLYVVLATTFLAYLLNIFALKFVKSTTVSIYIYSQPVIASILAVFLGSDNITFLKIISAILVFNGVYFVSRPSSS